MTSGSSSLSGTQVLVTGGAGFIGSNLVEQLVKEGARVRVLDNFTRGIQANLTNVRDEVEVVEGNLLDADALDKAVRDTEVIFHQAAVVSVPYSVQNPTHTTEVNVAGTLNLLIAARDAGARRLVFASSCSVYGANLRLPKRETFRAKPISPYAASKLTGEMYCSVFNSLWDIETVSLRYFNVFGPRQPANSEYASVIPLFITMMLQGEQPTIFGDGYQRRDFTYVDNVVSANILSATAPKAAGKVFNVGCGQPLDINELVDSLNGMLETDIKPRYAPTRAGDVRDAWADITLAQRVLGYQPDVDVTEGLRRTVGHIRENL
jgi:nucleoside-diphosphate-sugar epimerase